ncbi:acetyltransferase YpeA [mine drainage metagenome]|uniref:Acetyltransferase YpeA n=1 Tax=mine drainage metagenome TaxID=410659 RepID=A0A1J5R9F3_9ZZZZ
MRLPIELHPLHESDYPKLIKLWASSEWVDVRQTDTPEALAGFLRQNPACNYAAHAGTRLVGAVLAGHDGWRGYLYHMAVKPEYRERGIGAQLVNAAVTAIRKEGIPRVHCLVKRNNLVAQQFWEACGFQLRDELYDFSL